MAVLETIVFMFLFKVKFFYQADFKLILVVIFSIILANIIYFIISYLVSLIAFWSREAMGPRFLFEWILEFASGAYFPLDILSPVIFTFLLWFPFMYLLYIPMAIYLGRYDLSLALLSVFVQLFWISLLSALTYYIWKKGLKKFTGEGI